MTDTTYNLSTIDDFINTMYDVFLKKGIESVQLIVAKIPNEQEETTSKKPLHFLDFAFNLLKSIKIHAKFFFDITITKTQNDSIPQIKIEFLPNRNAQTVYNYQITNPDNNQIMLSDGKNDSYIINEILDFEIEKSKQIKIIKIQPTQNKKEYIYIISRATENTTSNSNDFTTEAISGLLHKNYTNADVFNIYIFLEYTKVNAQTIIINKIAINNGQ